MKKAFGLLFLFCFSNSLFSQTSPACHLRISLLTCSPGEELYSTFGHSALRVSDSVSGTDLIYNYGTFDFDDPSFYSKFVRGNLLYFVSVDKIENFLEEYETEKRGVMEQVLNLSCEEKEKLLASLQNNAKEENKYYKYDFIYDNCTTRLRDIVFKNAASPVYTQNILARKGVSFRNLIHEYLDKSYQYWSKLGIDLLLGSPLDKKISNSEAMFLPDYLLKAFDSTTILEKKLVSQKTEILKPILQENKSPLFSPFVVFTLLFVLIAISGFLKSTQNFLLIIDFILFFLTGALGILMLFMWLGTDHPECRNNFNLAWAFPLHFFFVFFIYKKRNWVRNYFLANSILLSLLLILWKWLPQEMNNALIPFIFLMLLRSLMRYKKLKHAV